MNTQYGQDRFKKFDQHALKVLEIAHQEAPDSRYEPLIANISPRAIRNTPVKN